MYQHQDYFALQVNMRLDLSQRAKWPLDHTQAQ
jgi:hypothetical protein